MAHRIHLTTGTVGGEVVPPDRHYDQVTGVQILNSGDYTNASAAAPVTYTVVSSAPSSATEVEFSGTDTLTFYTGTSLDTTYGTVVVAGYTAGQIQH